MSSGCRGWPTKFSPSWYFLTLHPRNSPCLHLLPPLVLVTDNVEGSSVVAVVIPKLYTDVENEFIDSQENFQEPRCWWHGRESSYEGETDYDKEDNNEMDMEGGRLEDILT